ncbi:polyphosphate--glucose phosphotransferase [Bacteroidota bacterium]
MKKKKVLGIDIGGSGIKAAPVNTEDGLMLEPRHRISTPSPSTPGNVAKVIEEMVRHFKWKGLIGCGFPAVMQNGVAKTAANIDDSWIGADVNKIFSEATGLPVYVVNDADVAGMAEMKFGAGQGKKGVVVLCTVGTGIGTVIFNNGYLVPNTELGHFEYKGMDVENYVSDAVRKAEDLSWEEWGGRFDEYLAALEKLIYPDLIILGGGASKKGDKFLKYLTIKTPLETAQLLNNAGIVGAALAARYLHKKG